TDDFASSLNADLHFLQERNLVTYLPHRTVSMKQTPETEPQMAYFRSLVEVAVKEIHEGSEDTATALKALEVINDVILRGISAQFNDDGKILTVPLCQAQLPETLNVGSEPKPSEVVLRVALETFPAPGESSAWQDILGFKAEAHDKM